MNSPLLLCAVLWLVAILTPDHPHHDAGQAFFFIMGAASFCLAVIFELVTTFGG